MLGNEELIEALEGHLFEPLRFAQWRNSALDFSSIERLDQSLNRASPDPFMVRVRRGVGKGNYFGSVYVLHWGVLVRVWGGGF